MSTIIQAVILLCIPAMVCLALMILRGNYLLGFPSAIFWGIAGGYAYQQSTATWDIPYFVFFGAMGMVIFCLIAMPALRRRDTAGPDADKGAFIDEKGGRRTGRRYSSDGEELSLPRESDFVGHWGDIDRLGMNDTSDVLYDNAVQSRAAKRQADRQGRLDALHERAENRKRKVDWGSLA